MPSAPFITITRINSTIKDLFTNIFDLSPLEVDLLLFLIANNDAYMTLEELAKETNRDKSTCFQITAKISNSRNMYKGNEDNERRRILSYIWCDRRKVFQDNYGKKGKRNSTKL